MGGASLVGLLWAGPAGPERKQCSCKCEPRGQTGANLGPIFVAGKVQEVDLACLELAV